MSSVERISALLAKAERTDNAHEAEAYLMKAQQLATAASIDLALARAHAAMGQRRAEPEMRTVTIGEKGRRANPHLIALFVAIAHANDAHVDIASNSTFVMSYGMPSDLDVIEAMYALLSVQMVAQSQAWLASGQWRGTNYVRVERTSWRTRRVERPHTAQTARTAFYRGYVERITERLGEAKEQALAQSRESGVSSDVVLRDKAREVSAFHRRASQARGAWQGYSGAVRGDRGQSASAGRAAAQRARLTSDPAVGGGRPAIGG